MTLPLSRSPGGAGWARLGSKLAEPAAPMTSSELFGVMQHYTDRAKSQQGRPPGYNSLGPVGQTHPLSIPTGTVGVGTARPPAPRAPLSVIQSLAVNAGALFDAGVQGVTGVVSFATRSGTFTSKTMPRLKPESDGLQNFVTGAGGAWGWTDPLKATAQLRADAAAKMGAAKPAAGPGPAVAIATPAAATARKWIIPAAIAAGVVLFVVL
jgi:hypothetical protein